MLPEIPLLKSSKNTSIITKTRSDNKNSGLINSEQDFCSHPVSMLRFHQERSIRQFVINLC